MLRIILSLMAAGAALAADRTVWVTGRVLDPSEASVPRAVVQARADGVFRAALTDEQGVYRLGLPHPGTYTIVVENPGFSRFERTLPVDAAGTQAVNVALAIGGMAEEVTVTAKTPPSESALETDTRNFEEVLEIRQVKESGARDVGDALAAIGGISKLRKGGIANDVVLRGFGQSNLNVLIDGARIYGACPNHMDPPAFHVDFAEIQQVDVTKGAFDVRNEGSLGGTVNVLSRSPLPGLRISPNFSAGSFGFVNPSVSGSLVRGQASASAGYSMRRAEPFRDGSGRRFTDYANYQSSISGVNAFDVDTSWFRFGFAPTEMQRFSVGYTRQRGGETLYPYLQMDAVYDNADRLNAKYDIYAGGGALSRVRTEAYYTRVNHWMTDERRLSSAGAPRPYGMATFAATKALGGRVEAEFAHFVTGVEMYRRNWNATNTMRMAGMYMDQASMPDVNITAAGIYGQYRRQFGALQVNAGIRADTAGSEARSLGTNKDLFWAYKGTRSLSARDTTGSANIWLAYTLAPGLELFAGTGRSNRIPDPQERYFNLRRSGSDWVGNPDLRPTTNTETDIGVNYKSRYFSVRPTMYYSRLTDFITVHNQARLNMIPGIMNTAARSYENVDARMYGGELNWSATPQRMVLVSGGVSYTRATKEPRPEFRIYDRDLSEMPPLRTRLAVRVAARRFFGEAEGIAARRQNRVDADLREAPTPGYGVVNLKAGIRTGKFHIAGGVDNVFNRYYYDHFSFQRDAFRTGTRVPEPGRSVFISVSAVVGR